MAAGQTRARPPRFALGEAWLVAPPLGHAPGTIFKGIGAHK